MVASEQDFAVSCHRDRDIPVHELALGIERQLVLETIWNRRKPWMQYDEAQESMSFVLGTPGAWRNACWQLFSGPVCLFAPAGMIEETPFWPQKAMLAEHTRVVDPKPEALARMVTVAKECVVETSDQSQLADNARVCPHTEQKCESLARRQMVEGTSARP